MEIITKKFHILVVDDNEDAATALGKLLTKLGHTVEVVFDGPGALRAITSWKPEIALLDIGLPEMDGYEVARQIKIMGLKAYPILIAISGYGQEEDKQKAFAAGFDYYLTKPVGIQELTEIFQK